MAAKASQPLPLLDRPVCGTFLLEEGPNNLREVALPQLLLGNKGKPIQSAH